MKPNIIRIIAGALLFITANGHAADQDVRKHRAAGDGITLDTAAFQAAIDAAKAGGGGVVRVPPGKYLVAHVELRSNVTLHLDNTQISDGGVDVTATFEGNTGYDSYISAEAYGNQALAYACAECKADANITSTQVNNGDVNATSTVNVNQGRSIVSSARAVGNSATYYVSGGK